MFRAEERSRRGRPAFTILELMVACAVLVLILSLLFSMLSQTTSLWNSTTGKVQQFERAREAFEIMTGRLSQATLNTFWDYQYNASGTPIAYVRQAELRFLVGQASTLVGGSPAVNPGQAVFFQAPGGTTLSAAATLPGALCTWGYFVQYGSDQDYIPGIVGLTPRYRYRLIEMMEPADRLSIYTYTSGDDASYNAKNLSYTGQEWFKNALSATSPNEKRILAENVIALVLLPKLPTSDDPTGAALAPDFGYDSTASRNVASLNPKNQLPPLMEVTLVAIDDRSAARVQWGSVPPDFGLNTLFKSADRTQLLQDLDTLEGNLRKVGCNPHRFTVTVALPAAKWSSDQVN